MHQITKSKIFIFNRFMNKTFFLRSLIYKRFYITINDFYLI